MFLEVWKAIYRRPITVTYRSDRVQTRGRRRGQPKGGNGTAFDSVSSVSVNSILIVMYLANPCAVKDLLRIFRWLFRPLRMKWPSHSQPSCSNSP
jgi:hypothetical protein